MTETTQAVKAHRAAYEDPERLGDPVEDWFDEEGYLCIRWSCGQWWHCNHSKSKSTQKKEYIIYE